MTYDEMDELQNYYATRLPKSFTRRIVDSETPARDPNFDFLNNKFPEFKQAVDLFLDEHKDDN